MKRNVASVVAFVTIVAVALVIAPMVGIVAIPVAYAVGTAVKVILLAVFVTRRLAAVERADVPPPPEPA